jgi:peroxiredoxin Q/BCP
MRRIITLLALLMLVPLNAFACETLLAGTAAPAFTLPDQNGEYVTLSQFKDKWVVLYFYPKDFTSGCSVEAHNFQEDLAQYAQKNAVILGVSVDSTESHKSFCAKESLTFTLLADTEHTVSDLYCSIMGFGLISVAARHTFLIDPSGIIRKVYLDVSPPTHSQEVLADLDALQGAEEKK